MSWWRVHKRSAWIVALTLAIPLVIYLNTLFGLWGARQSFQKEIDNIEPRIARLRGLVEHESELHESAGKVDKRVLNLVYARSDDSAAVSADLQAKVRDLFVDSGLSVTNSQILPVREEEGFDYIGLKLTVSGGIDALDAALGEINTYRPLLLVEAINLWPDRKRRQADADSQTVSATIQLLSLRAAG